MYTVIFFGTDNSVGQEYFTSLYLAGEFEDVMLERGYTTSGVLTT